MRIIRSKTAYAIVDDDLKGVAMEMVNIYLGFDYYDAQNLCEHKKPIRDTMSVSDGAFKYDIYPSTGYIVNRQFMYKPLQLKLQAYFSEYIQATGMASSRPIYTNHDTIDQLTLFEPDELRGAYGYIDISGDGKGNVIRGRMRWIIVKTTNVLTCPAAEYAPIALMDKAATIVLDTEHKYDGLTGDIILPRQKYIGNISLSTTDDIDMSLWMHHKKLRKPQIYRPLTCKVYKSPSNATQYKKCGLCDIALWSKYYILDGVKSACKYCMHYTDYDYAKKHTVITVAESSYSWEQVLDSDRSISYDLRDAILELNGKFAPVKEIAMLAGADVPVRRIQIIGKYLVVDLRFYRHADLTDYRHDLQLVYII